MITVEQRQEIEKTIVARLINDLLKAGFVLRVWDGEAWASESSNNADKLFAACFSTDDDSITVYRENRFIGQVDLVYGNDGYDVISDYSISLEHVLGPLQAFCESLDPRNESST